MLVEWKQFVFDSFVEKKRKEKLVIPVDDDE